MAEGVTGTGSGGVPPLRSVGSLSRSPSGRTQQKYCRGARSGRGRWLLVCYGRLGEGVSGFGRSPRKLVRRGRGPSRSHDRPSVVPGSRCG
mgnify:CR=1 FL=1